MLLAYFMFNTRKSVTIAKVRQRARPWLPSPNLNSVFTFPQPYLILGWTFTLLATLGVILLMLPANQGNIPSPAYAAVYSATSRLVWSLGLSWITFVSLHNYGGLVSAFLCAKVWVPLSRLTYCAYLVHPIIIAIFYGSRHQTFDYSFYLIVSAPSLPLPRLSILALTAMPLSLSLLVVLLCPQQHLHHLHGVLPGGSLRRVPHSHPKSSAPQEAIVAVPWPLCTRLLAKPVPPLPSCPRARNQTGQTKNSLTLFQMLVTFPRRQARTVHIQAVLLLTIFNILM